MIPVPKTLLELKSQHQFVLDPRNRRWVKMILIAAILQQKSMEMIDMLQYLYNTGMWKDVLLNIHQISSFEEILLKSISKRQKQIENYLYVQTKKESLHPKRGKNFQPYAHSDIMNDLENRIRLDIDFKYNEDVIFRRGTKCIYTGSYAYTKGIEIKDPILIARDVILYPRRKESFEELKLRNPTLYEQVKDILPSNILL